MGYDAVQVRDLARNSAKVYAQFHELMLKNLAEAATQLDQSSREYLQRGVGRRLNVIQLSLGKIYDLFPPSRSQPLPKATLSEVQVYLHAFVINLSGIFDCWAWAFVLRHGLLAKIGGPRRVGMFLARTQRFLPPELYTYVTTEPIKSWHRDYLKSYRDALAHRIPLYIPPSVYTKADMQRHDELGAHIAELLHAQRTTEAERAMDEQEQLGEACMVFLQELSSDPNSKPVFLHPQLNSDAAAVIEFGNKFYDNWHRTSTPATESPTHQPAP
jgi:hypothetical protein